jgi:acyl carrier protein
LTGLVLMWSNGASVKGMRMSLVTDREVQEIVAAILEVHVADVGIDASFYADLEMDSLYKAELIAMLERACGAEFTPAEAAEIDSVRDVMRMLRDRQQVL